MKKLIHIFSAALLMVAGAANAGYLVDTNGIAVKNSYGECWHTMGTLGEHGGESPVECGGMKPPVDSDGDGVYDDKDQCPNTAKGVKVDSVGCEVLEPIVLEGVHFEYNKSSLTPAAMAILDSNVAAITRNMNRIKGIHVVGHTDSRGSKAYNQKLSEKRAMAVVDYLTSKGVSASKLMSMGMGEENPIADNGTAEGRAKNRRVEITFE